MDMIQPTLQAEIDLRVKHLSEELAHKGYDAMLVSSNVNLYYVSGRVFGGYAYITADGSVTYFVKRPVGLTGANVKYIRKPEQISEHLEHLPKKLALEQDSLTYNDYKRLAKAFEGVTLEDASAILNKVRAVKTPFEIAKIKECAVHHDMVYKHIRSLYHEGMTDLELQIEIERRLRMEGSLGVFRIHGESMEIFMGNVICGDNADAPSPYDFAMGGAGLDESLPIGCNGSTIHPGMTVMVDMGGSFNGYMTDMTRVFYVGNLNETARKAHELSIAIHHRIAKECGAGTPASEIYKISLEMVKEAGLEHYFMGHKQQAGYVGHGVGIEINEAPVLAPRSKDILQEGNVIALEPKFVIPKVGAVGIENTYIVRADHLECVNNFPEELVELF